MDKIQRLQIYKKALELIEKDIIYSITGLCCWLSDSIRELELTECPYPYNSLESYIEIYNQKPEELWNEQYWFITNKEGFIRRKLILINAINQLELELNISN